MKARGICKIVSVVVGILLISLGISVKWSIFPNLVDKMVKAQLELKPENTETWEAWIEPPIIPYMKFTFLNVTNTMEVKAGTAKPNVVEIGPFTYREIRRKEDIQIVEDKISLGSYIGYQFDESESCETCKFDSEVTAINPVLVLVADVILGIQNSLPETVKTPTITIPCDADCKLAGLIMCAKDTETDTCLGYTIPEQEIPVAEVIKLLLSGMSKRVNCEAGTPADQCDDLFLTGTPDDMVFTGIHSGVIKALYAELVNVVTAIANLVEAGLGDAQGVEILDRLLAMAAVPPMIDLKKGTFGAFMGKNPSKTWWKINSGKYNMAHYNKIEEFNGNSRLPDGWWDNFGPTPSAHSQGVTGVCHDIAGTDGLGYAPSVEKDRDIWLFNDQLCRSIWLSFSSEINIDGITAYRFEPSDDVLSMSNPDNLCFCPKVEKCAIPDTETDTWNLTECQDWEGKFKCLDGLLSLEGCQGAPVLMSTPHFLGGDPRLSEAVDGMDPVRVTHVTYLDLEPTTGLPLRAHKRMQVNVGMYKVDWFDALQNINDTVFPLLWVDEGADIDKENLKKLKAVLVTPFLAVDIGSGLAIGIGGLILIGITGHAIWSGRGKSTSF